MTNKANIYRPTKFSEILSQEKHVRLVTNLIRYNKHADIKCLMLAGPPGCSKSTLANLYARATLCRNRKAGEYEPCGECPICLGEDTANIHEYVFSENNAQTKAEINRLIEISYQYPISTTKESHRYRRFIIIDEAELATPENLALLLKPLEHSPSTTTWIIISMDLEKLEKKEPIICEAITSRSIVLRMNRLSKEEIAKGLLNKYDLDHRSALLIGEISKGNMRDAWNIITHLLILEGDIENINEEKIYSLYLGGAHPDSRNNMWEALSKGEAKEVARIVEGWEKLSPDPKYIATLLEKDILYSIINFNTSCQDLLTDLAIWHGSSNRYSLLAVLLNHLNISVKVQMNIKKEESVRDSINGQLMKALNKRKGIPFFLASKSFKECSERYSKGDILHNLTN
ncbi:hypothetical protein H6G33_10530 [Calothrix sp. FACHB-1219]|uniref:hypothetical protein n=1 Tax=unclassified Calothrix TaxID=2619626 RepID=UPI001682BA88|nr:MULTISPECIES: hypothetical protein [unclassified Calothrix]MBD2201783.1 hypothetical protein [Calothrix sp. FACHB-168]MBD2217469.1 hypothetical protein [Calothrix sp. FACHB-1219]